MVEIDIAIIGAGPAGLNAAVAAADLGAGVALIDGYEYPGGQYFRQFPQEFRVSRLTDRYKQAEDLFAQIRRPEITYRQNSQVWNIDSDLNLDFIESSALGHLKPKAVILATGAYDRPAAFPGWTLPGVMTVGAAQILVKAQRVLPGRKILIAGSGPILLALGALLVWAGAEVVAVLEASQAMKRFNPLSVSGIWGQSDRLKEGWEFLRTLRKANVPYRQGWGIRRALGVDAVQGAACTRLDQHWRPIPGSEEQITCDTICIGYGFLPKTALSCLAGAAQIYRPEQGGWVPRRDNMMRTTIPGLYAAGDGAGIGGAGLSAAEGRIAGTAAAYEVSGKSQNGPDLEKLLAGLWKTWDSEKKFQKLFGELYTPGPGIDEWVDGETIICRCERVDLKAVDQAVRMGASNVDAVKGLTRAGMGACQGHICGRILAGQIARLSGRGVKEVGSLSPRPPVQPLSIGEAAGS